MHDKKPERIPPAYALKFQSVANDACDRARLDPEDSLFRADELRIHLEERWRDWRDKGLSKDDAAEKALELFGSPSLTGKSLREPWYWRLTAYERYRPHRYLVFIAAFGFYSWLTVYTSVFQALDHLKDSSSSSFLFSLVVPNGARFFITGAGSIFVGVAAAASLALMRWKPYVSHPLLKQVASWRHLLAVVVILAVAQLSLLPTYTAFSYGNLFEVSAHFGALNIVRLLRLGGILLGWCGAACMISELCGPPKALVRGRYSDSRSTPALSYQSLLLWSIGVCMLSAFISYPKLFPKSRFYEQVRYSDRVEVKESHYNGIVITGAHIATITEAIARASRDSKSLQAPLGYDYFEIRFFAGTNLLGTAPSHWSGLLIEQVPYRYSEHDLDRLRTLAFTPAHDHAGVQSRAEREAKAAQVLTDQP